MLKNNSPCFDKLSMNETSPMISTYRPFALSLSKAFALSPAAAAGVNGELLSSLLEEAKL